MKTICLFAMMLLSYVFLVGMGPLGGPGSIKVPEPAKNYAATIVDRTDISTRVEKFSFDGQTAISGKLGDGHVSISFDNISSINFVLKDKTLQADVLLKDGKTVHVVVKRLTPCYGKLSYGEFKINTEDVKSITIHGLVQEKQ